MSIVVFDPDSVEDVDFADRMRHPAAADPAGGMWLSDTEPSFIDADALRKGRLRKLRNWMAETGYGAVVLFDPYNQRYATGSRNMFGYFLRNSTRYFFIPTEGPIVIPSGALNGPLLKAVAFQAPPPACLTRKTALPLRATTKAPCSTPSALSTRRRRFVTRRR